MLRSKSIFAVILALSFFFNEAQAGVLLDRAPGFGSSIFWWRRPTVIGYAKLPAAQARLINQKNKLQYMEGSQPSLDKLGRGIYLINDPTSWLGEREDWYCAIKANKRKMRDTGKIWIPKAYKKSTPNGPRKQDLWAQSEDVILEYIKLKSTALDLKLDSAKALRFCQNYQLQMLIPKKAVIDGDLDLWAQCFESEYELKQFSDDVIDWKSWGIKGSRGKAAYEPGKKDYYFEPLDYFADYLP